MLPTARDAPLDALEAAARYCPLCGVPTPAGMCPVHQVPGVAYGPALTPTLQPGTVLGGRYRIDHVLLAQGTQGTYLATALGDGRTVVLESFPSERLARRARLLDSLVRRPEIAAHFMRPELAQVLDFGVEPVSQTPFLVMAYDAQRGPQAILTQGSAERHTAALFLQTCLGVLDQHDREFLGPAGAMPTAVPYTAVPQAQPMAVQLIPPKKSKKERDGQSKFLGLPGHLWVAFGMLAVLVVYYVIDDESMYSPYYNPRVTEPTRLGWYGAGNKKQDKKRSPLEEMMQAGGEVEISSNPAGAEVWVGGRMVGETPTTVPRPVGGDRAVVILKRQGFLDKQLNLSPESTGVNVRMIPVNGGDDPAGLVGEREQRYDPMKSRFDKSPFAKSPFEDSPLNRPVVTNPFGPPGTRAPAETPEELDEEDQP